MSNKHMPYDLQQMQSLPLEAKEIMSDQRIVQWFEYWNGEVYVSFSGGKDSTVLANLCAKVCQRYGWTLYLLFCNTGLEFPEIQKHVKQYAEWLRHIYQIKVELTIVRPKMRFDEVLKRYGYPVISKQVSNAVRNARKNIRNKKYSLRLCQLGVHESEYGGLEIPEGYDFHNIVAKSKFRKTKYRFLLDAPFESSEQCCDVMKKKPASEYEKATGRKPIVGTLASESMLRENNWLRHGCNAFGKKKPSSQPLSFWTEQDILHYIKAHMQPSLDAVWQEALNARGFRRRRAKKLLKSIGYMKSIICSVYGEIVVDDKAAEIEGQINLIDYLGCHEESDILKTTGCDRTGCIFCMFGCHLEKEPNRFQRLKETHPRQYEYCIGGGEMVDGKWQPSKEGLGLGKVLDYIGVKYD